MSVSRAAAPTAPQVLRLQRQERPQCWGLQAGALARWSPAVPSGASLPAAVWPLSEAALMAAFQRDCPLNTLVRMQSCSDTRGAGGGARPQHAGVWGHGSQRQSCHSGRRSLPPPGLCRTASHGTGRQPASLHAGRLTLSPGFA